MLLTASAMGRTMSQEGVDESRVLLLSASPYGQLFNCIWLQEKLQWGQS